jgi:hypothetical protein
VSDDSTKPSNPFASRGFIAAAIVIGVILLAGVVVLVTSLTAPHTPVAQPTSTPSGPVASGDDKSVCGLKGFETESSLTAAPDAKWELVGTVAAPTDPKVGPGSVSAGFRTCFSHTAEGALFAAINYVALASDSRNIPKIPDLIAPGKGKDAALAQATSSPTASATRLQVAGFKINSYSAGEATVDVVWSVTSQDNALVSFPTVLKWTGGDWKIVLNDDGQPPFAPAQLQSLGGYIPWAGV